MPKHFIGLGIIAPRLLLRSHELIYTPVTLICHAIPGEAQADAGVREVGFTPGLRALSVVCFTLLIYIKYRKLPEVTCIIIYY